MTEFKPLEEMIHLDELNVNDLKKGFDDWKKELSKLVFGKGLRQISVDGVMEFRTNSVTTKNVDYWTQHIVLVDWFDAIAQTDLTYAQRANLAVFGDLMVRCNDPSFLYHGFSYILTQLDTNADTTKDWDGNTGPEERFPDIRNPELKGVVCKHLIVVLEILPFKVSSVAKAMKDFVDRGKIGITDEGTAYVVEDGAPEVDPDTARKVKDTGEEPTEEPTETEEESDEVTEDDSEVDTEEETK